MSNVFVEVGHGIEVAAVDTAKVVEKIATGLPHAIALVDEVIKDEPAAKALIANLISEAGTVITAGTTAVASDGTNLLADAATLAAAEAFFAWFKATFIPTAETLYKDIAATVKV